MAKFEIFKDTGGYYRFRFRASNGEIVAQSEAYTTDASAENGIAVIKREAPSAPVVDLTQAAYR